MQDETYIALAVRIMLGIAERRQRTKIRSYAESGYEIEIQDS
jgi:hypothetical protein